MRSLEWPAPPRPFCNHRARHRMTTSRPLPELSVILVTDRLETIRKTLAHFRAQTIRDRIEIVVGAPAGSDVSLDAPDFEGFADVRLVELEEASVRNGRALTLRSATAPIVAVGETHAFPWP